MAMVGHPALGRGQTDLGNRCEKPCKPCSQGNLNLMDLSRIFNSLSSRFYVLLGAESDHQSITSVNHKPFKVPVIGIPHEVMRLISALNSRCT